MNSKDIGFGVSRAESWAGLEDNLNNLIKFAEISEELGFNSAHVGDHVFVAFEPLTALTAMAMKTKKLKLATNILDMNRRNPATMAHATATLDQFSGGRLILGAGCGMWNWATYNVPNMGDTGIGAGRKLRRAREATEVLKKFWTEPEVNYNGEFFNYEKARIETKPLQKPHPPIWIAAYGKRMKKVAAELGDGFITQTVPPDMYREEVEKIAAFASEAGRDPANIKPVFATLTSIDHTHEDAVKNIQKSARSLLFRSARDHTDHHNKLALRLGYDKPFPWEKEENVSEDDICQVYLIGTPEEIITKIEEYMKGGMKYVIAMGLYKTESLKMFSEKVISCFQ